MWRFQRARVSGAWGRMGISLLRLLKFGATRETRVPRKRYPVKSSRSSPAVMRPCSLDKTRTSYEFQRKNTPRVSEGSGGRWLTGGLRGNRYLSGHDGVFWMCDSMKDGGRGLFLRGEMREDKILQVCPRGWQKVTSNKGFWTHHGKKKCFCKERTERPHWSRQGKASLFI